jgi:hypothetical protein
MRRIIAGDDTTSRGGLPANELLAPLPLAMLLVLAFNDWVLKGSSAPVWLTGKLSDFAGLFAFPLVVTAASDLASAALARLGVAWDFTLRRWKLATTIALTAIVFAAMKLSPVVGSWVEALWSGLVPGDSAIYPDRSDVIALVVLAGTWWHGRRTIARGAYGRLALAKQRHAAGTPLERPFGDAIACGADRALVDELDAAVTAWLSGGPAVAVDAALARLRATAR